MDILNNAYESLNAQIQQNNAWSAQQAQKVMDWQTDLANTAHQREVADLKAAGLNPILSAHGNGAATPSGAQVNADTNNTAFLASVFKDLIASNTAVGVANAKAAGGGYIGNNQTEGDKDRWNTEDPLVFTTKGVENTAKKLKTAVAFLPKWIKDPIMKGINFMQNNAEYIAKGVNHAGGKTFTDTTNDVTNQWAEQNIFEGMNF